MDSYSESLVTTLSWNTSLSRTSLSGLTRAFLSNSEDDALHGLDDVIQAVGALRLNRYRYEELAREEVLGEGETYMVEKCVIRRGIFAVKHLKVSNSSDPTTFRRRLRAVVHEVQIMRHGPLRQNPHILSVDGYGWNTQTDQILPYLVVEYAPLGTLREYLTSKQKIMLRDIEILTGDVAAAISALHSCGIIHGDVKLDNVLVFPTYDSPAGALAKMTDFGHSIVTNASSREGKNHIPRYRGTLIYNAPEVENQDSCPIDICDLSKCDIWAFGLLVWEACIGGRDYVSYARDNGFGTQPTTTDELSETGRLLQLAKCAVPMDSRHGRLGSHMFLTVTLHYTLQEDPNKRIADIGKLPLLKNMGSAHMRRLQGNLALLLEDPRPSYEMFRVENGRGMPWIHEEQIFYELQRVHAEGHQDDGGVIAWQLALCYCLGFGTSVDPVRAQDLAKAAANEGHAAAKVFAYLFTSRGHVGSKASYDKQIVSLLQPPVGFEEMPELIKAFFHKDSARILSQLSSNRWYSNPVTMNGWTPFHWLFKFSEETELQAITDTFKGFSQPPLIVDAPLNLAHEVHNQWPLQLLGTPLSLAISVNNLAAVKALLSLGANPIGPVYWEEQFPAIELGSVLLPMPFATRQCSSGPRCMSISMMSENGMTALMQAIDFQDLGVAEALLRAQPRLAREPFFSRTDPKEFTLPLHFSAQVAATRDLPEALSIMKLMDSCFPPGLDDAQAKSATPARDSRGRTALHLAVTGVSSLAAQWILGKQQSLVLSKDDTGRTPLHCSGSSANTELLIKSGPGALINQGDVNGMTPLHWACSSGQSAVLQCLVKHGANPALTDSKLRSSLHWAVIGGSVDCVMMLLELGVPLNQRDVNGNTARQLAHQIGRYNIRRMLEPRLGSYPRNPGERGGIIERTVETTWEHGEVFVRDEERQALQADLDTNDEQESAATEVVISQLPIVGRSEFFWDAPVVEEADPWDGATGTQNQATEIQHRNQGRQSRYNKLCMETLRYLTMDNSRKSGRCVQAVIKLVTVFFEGSIWQPPFLTAILEVLVMTAQDIVNILKDFRGTSLKSLGFSNAIGLLEEKAAECVAALVKDTKPAFAFPGKCQESIRHMVLWELDERRRRNQWVLPRDNLSGLKENSGFPLRLFSFHPELSSLEKEATLLMEGFSSLATGERRSSYAPWKPFDDTYDPYEVEHRAAEEYPRPWMEGLPGVGDNEITSGPVAARSVTRQAVALLDDDPYGWEAELDRRTGRSAAEFRGIRDAKRSLLHRVLHPQPTSRHR